MEIILNILSTCMAFLAAGFWLYSAKTTVPPSEEPDETGIIPAIIRVDGADFVESAKRQARYSAVAAVFAGMAALFQGVVPLMSIL